MNDKLVGVLQPKKWNGYQSFTSCTCKGQTSGLVVHPTTGHSFCMHKRLYTMCVHNAQTDANNEPIYKIYTYDDNAFEYTYDIKKTIYEKWKLDTFNGAVKFHYYKHCKPNSKSISKEYRHSIMQVCIQKLKKNYKVINNDDIATQIQNLDKGYKRNAQKAYEDLEKTKNVKLLSIERINKSKIAKPTNINHNRRYAARESDQKAAQISKQIAEKAGVIMKMNLGTGYVFLVSKYSLEKCYYYSYIE